MATGNILLKTPSLSGRISADGTLSGTISAPASLSGTITGAANYIKLYPDYDGEYVIVPKARENQTLETKGKRMKDNVTVKEIPVYRVSNTSGGETVYIAGSKELTIL